MLFAFTNSLYRSPPRALREPYRIIGECAAIIRNFIYGNSNIITRECRDVMNSAHCCAAQHSIHTYEWIGHDKPIIIVFSWSWEDAARSDLESQSMIGNCRTYTFDQSYIKLWKTIWLCALHDVLVHTFPIRSKRRQCGQYPYTLNMYVKWNGFNL